RRMCASVAAVAVVLATAIVISAPAGAFTTDGIQAVDVSTTPAGSVTVGQSFAVDVQWNGQAGGLAPRWGLSISIPNEVQIDGFTPTSICSRNAQVIDCRVAQGAPPITALTVHVNVTAVSEAYNAKISATAVSPEISSVTDSTTINLIPPGLTAEVH